MGSELSDRYYIPLPVWTKGNVYFNGAKPCDKEKDFYEDTENSVKLELLFNGDEWKLETNLFDLLPDNCDIVTTGDLGMAFEPEQKYENPDGSEIVFDEDIFGKKRVGKTIAGPMVK